MINKVIFSVIILILIGILSIPYWTGKEIERQFPRMNESFYKMFDLKVLDSTYERAWFRSYAETLLESSSNNQRFILVQKINHGFLPIELSQVHSTLHSAHDPEFKQPALVSVQTTLQMNGDSVSRIKMPNLGFQDKKADLQWQGLQGVVYAKGDLSKMQVELQNPQIQLVTSQGQIIIQKVSLKADMQPHQKQGEGTVTVPYVRLTGKQKPAVVLKGIKLAAENNILGNNLMFTLKTGLQEMQVGTDHYGPGIGNFELHRWHVPTLLNIKNALTEIQTLPFQQRKNMAMLRLLPYGITFLENKPEFAMTRLNFNMPEGELSSTLQVKIEQDLSPLALFNPSMLINAVTAQLEMSIPQSLLDNSTDETIQQQLKIWLDKGRLIPTADNQYYYSQMHLKKGMLQINGETMPISTFLK
jgi:uncharacterized protein YdgA (DUF945 family)